WPHWNELALPAEEALRALTLRELIGVLEDEALVVEQVEYHAEVIGGGEARPLAATRVEMLVAGIERQREQALRSPFEAVLAAVAGLDRGAAVAGQNVDDLLEQVALRLALGTRREVEHEDRDEVAAPLEVDDAAFDPEARPPLRRHLDEVDAEIL